MALVYSVMKPDSILTRVFIGIDPGVQTGLAAWFPREEELKIWPALSFWDAYDAIWDYVVQHYDVTLVIEDPGGNKPVFHRGKAGRENLRIAQNVGSNKRDAALWIALFEKQCWHYEAFTPKGSKWTKQYFETITGYKGRSSSHARDAARFVYGRR